jgi:hypothetical protein
MKAISIVVLAFLFGLTNASCATEDEKNKQINGVGSIHLGDSFLGFEGEAPRNSVVAPDPPAGMTNFTKETTRPFLGLRFSTPLKEDFFKPGR